MWGRWLYVGVGALALLVLFFLYKKYRIAPDLDFPEMQLTDLSGKPVSLASYEGKPLVLSFAASWCGPCLKELSELEKVKGQVADVADIVIISDESLETIEGLRSRGFTFEFLKSKKVFADIGIHSIPTSYLLNSRGKVIKKEVGYIDWADAANRAHLLGLLRQ